MPEIGSPLDRVARALYEMMPERWAGGLEPSAVPWHAAEAETKARCLEAARVAIWTLRPVGDQMREAGQAVTPKAVQAWTAMIDTALSG